MHVLGLDVGNGKVKCCRINYSGDLETSQIEWQSLALKVSADRAADFRLSLPLQITEFCFQQGIKPSDFQRVVVCCSHSLSYDPFSDSIFALAEILQRYFKAVPVELVRADGQRVLCAEIAKISPSESYAFAFTNFYGSARLGQKLIRNGISLDLGTTTLDVIPILDGQIDPEGLRQPQAYLRYRYAHQRIHWLGLCATPLDMLSRRVPVGEAWHQIVPRHYFTDVLLALHPAAQQDLLLRHAYARRFPDRDKAERYLAEFAGLDRALMSSAELQGLQAFLWERYLELLAEAIQAVIDSCFPERPEDFAVASFALGHEMVLQPALQKLGLDPTCIVSLELQRERHLWSASSAFSMALLALEAELGEELPL